MWQRFSDLTAVQLRVKRRLWTAFVLDSNIQIIKLYDSLICSRSELKIMEFHVRIWFALMCF